MCYSRRNVYIFYLAVLVIFCVHICACKKKDTNDVEQARTHVIVALDAAHGGTDTGTRNSVGKFEKQLVLAACNKMASMAPEYNIEVVLTRRDDTNPAAEERVQVADAAKADLFISVHINKNFTGTQQRVYEVFVPTDNPVLPECRALTNAILSRIATAGKDTVHTDKIVLVLKNNARPAIAIECGDIDKEADVATMEDPEQLCRYLLEGIVTYVNSK